LYKSHPLRKKPAFNTTKAQRFDHEIEQNACNGETG